MIPKLLCLATLAAATFCASATQVSNNSCRKNEWLCWDGACIASRFQCDGVVDCEDASDENIDSCLFVYIQSLTVVGKLAGANKQNVSLEGTKFDNDLAAVVVDTKPSLTAQFRQLNTSCILPEYPRYGHYAVTDKLLSITRPGESYDSFTLDMYCIEGFEVNGSSVVKCQNGLWLNPVPNCVPQCYLSSDPSVEYRCLVSGEVIGSRKCNEYEPVGTVVRPTCRSPDYYAPIPNVHMRCNSPGRWDNFPKCIEECGTVTADGSGLIYGGKKAKKAEVPWHAGVYDKAKKPYLQICGGSLVGVNVVISAAHCFWDAVVGQLPTNKYAVAVGKLYRPWNDTADEAQQSDLTAIHLPEHFQGSTSHYQSDVAIIITKNHFKFNLFVRPVCVDFDINFEKIQLQPGEMGKVAGWGLTSEKNKASQILQVVELPFVSTRQCIQNSPDSFLAYISGDKICAGLDKGGKAVCKGDSGGGLAFPSIDKGKKRYYLRGIVSTAPTNDEDTCYSSGYMAFTQLQIHEHFIKKFWTARAPGAGIGGGYGGSSGSGGVPDKNSGICELPPYPDHGTYRTYKPNAKPGDTFSSVSIETTCHQGYRLNGSFNNICKNGIWFDYFSTCIQVCKLRPHPSVDYYCLDFGQINNIRPCKEYEFTGTLASPQCRKPYYYSTSDLPYMRCINGTWDYVAKCTPECGTVTPSGKEYIIGGMPVAKGIEVPWYAGIYMKVENQYTFTCGGSLISNTVVLSAGHCFEGNMNNPQLFAVAVGKLYRSWNDNNHDEQKSGVKAIYLPSRYQGSLTNYQDDIAVVVVQKPFLYTLAIRPVCIDFHIIHDFKALQPRMRGKMAGWPIYGDGNSSQTLEVVDMPLIKITDCIYKSQPGFRKYLTSDKFCAGFTNGSGSLCKGNSGSGLVVLEWTPRKERFFIRGIFSGAHNSISRNGECTNNTYLTFTQILKHERFIKQFWDVTDADDDAERTQKGNCKLPEYPAHGTYVTNIPNAKPGDAFVSVTVNVTCQQGFEVDGSETVQCNNGWWPEKLPTCVAQCHLKADPSVEYRCLVSGDVDGYRPCNEYEKSGSVASPRCRSPYYSKKALPFMRCSDGNWDYIPKCSLIECGVVAPDGGQSSNMAEVPWHADVYTKTTSTYKPICGGSLISESIVISAAHCFWSTKRREPDNSFAVAVGKQYYLWEDSKNKAQRSDVLKVHLPDRFQGDVTNYQDDIAVVIVDKPFELNTFIRPVCVDLDTSSDKRQMLQWKIGKVTGWGDADASEYSSQALRVLDVPLVNVEACISKAAVELRQFITSDIICGIFIDSALCSSDSGSGLAFPKSVEGTEKYYLRGVLASLTNFENECSEKGDTAIFIQLLSQQRFIKKIWSQALL